jgi:hypothetical protein
MGGKDHARTGWGLIKLVDEDRTHALEAFHNKAVMDDLVADIDGRAELLQSQLDDADGAIHAGAKAPGRREQKRQLWPAFRLLILRRTSHESPASIQSRAAMAPVEKGARTGEKSSTESRLQRPSTDRT